MDSNLMFTYEVTCLFIAQLLLPPKPPIRYECEKSQRKSQPWPPFLSMNTVLIVNPELGGRSFVFQFGVGGVGGLKI